MRVLAGRLVVLAAAAVLSGIVLAQPKSDWEIKLEEREWQEGEHMVIGARRDGLDGRLRIRQ